VGNIRPYSLCRGRLTVFISCNFLFQNKQFIYNIFFYQKSCRLWENLQKYCRTRQATGGNIIRRVRFVCWITQTTDIHSEYVILNCFSTATIVKLTRLNVALYVNWLSGVYWPSITFLRWAVLCCASWAKPTYSTNSIGLYTVLGFV